MSLQTDLSSISGEFKSSVLSAPPTVTGGFTRIHDYGTSSVTNESTSRQTEGVRNSAQQRLRPRPTSADRFRLHEVLANVLQQARTLENASSTGDILTAADAGIDLRASLRELWRLRAARSDEWATIVSKLQIVTSNVEFEFFTQEMAMAVRLVIQDYLSAHADNDDVRAATVLLERNGLNSWKCLAPEDADAD